MRCIDLDLNLKNILSFFLFYFFYIIQNYIIYKLYIYNLYFIYNYRPRVGLDGDGRSMNSLDGVDKAQAGKLVRDIMDDEEQRNKNKRGEGKTSLDDLGTGPSIRMGTL